MDKHIINLSLILEFNSKMKLGDQQFNLRTILKIKAYSLHSVMISYVLNILTSQNRFQSLYVEIFNHDRFVE